MRGVIAWLEATVGKYFVTSNLDFGLAFIYLAAVDLQQGIRFGTGCFDVLCFGNKGGAARKSKAGDQDSDNNFSHDFLTVTDTVASGMFGLVEIVIRAINHRILIVIGAEFSYAKAAGNCANFAK